jgi:Cd2+/Zn2+-exporting ATPase
MLKLKTNMVSKVLGNEIVEVDCESLEIGDIFIVKVGEQIPVDGKIVEGNCSLDTSCLTGESLLVDKGVGDEVLSGSLNKAGIIKVQAIKDYEDSTYAKILDMVENATANKAPSEKFITKFARVYTPVVVFLALAIAIIPLFFQQDFSTWGYRACVFLVTSCPCALVVSVPLSYFVGIGKASRKGILVKGSNYLEELNKAKVIYLDKTGTITKGSFKVEEVVSFNVTKEEVIDVAASIEVLSNHPIAESIVKASNKTFSIENIKDHKEVVGKGIEAYVNDDFIKVGNYTYVNPNINEVKDVAGSVIYVSKNNELLGYLIIKDEIKEDALEVINTIHSYGIDTCMLTGDNEIVAKDVSNKVNIKNYKHDLLPLDKTTIIKQDDRKKVFVGDGVNDAPSLVGSDVGIAMGALGSDVAIESSDIVLMKDNLSALVDALKISKKTNKIVTQNIVFSLGIKVLIMLLGVFGLSTLWMAVFADVGVTLLAVLNSLRVNKIK